jgi:hypothetical protein
MPTLANINGASLTADVGGAINRGLTMRNNFDTINRNQADWETNNAKQSQIELLRGQMIPGTPEFNPNAEMELMAKDPEGAEKIFNVLGAQSEMQREDASRRAYEIANTPAALRPQVIQRQAAELAAQGRDPQHTLDLLNLDEQSQNQMLGTIQQAALTAKQRADLSNGGGLTAEQREFADLTKGLAPEQKQQAKMIKLGLSPRAVGSAIQTIADNDLAEVVGDAEATVANRKKFGEATGASRAKMIDDGFERITKIDAGIGNIDRAIDALRGGAKTGAIQQMVPSMRAASVELANIQKSMALDVIGAVTFGALSKGELDLAKEVALPTGLNEPQLIEHLQKRKAAQLKLRDYFQQQIDYLDQGGTVAGFLRQKERSSSPQPEQQPSSQTVGRFSVEVE